MMLDAAIEIAPTSGRRTKPSDSKTPAAMGSESELQLTAQVGFWCILRTVRRLIVIAVSTSSGSERMSTM
jgi:hypothetical protein